MHEELRAPDEHTVPTAHSKVRVVRGNGGDRRALVPVLEDWERSFGDGRDADVLAAVLEYCGGHEAVRDGRVVVNRRTTP